jgi:hypothetical protein
MMVTRSFGFVGNSRLSALEDLSSFRVSMFMNGILEKSEFVNLSVIVLLRIIAETPEWFAMYSICSAENPVSKGTETAPASVMPK